MGVSENDLLSVNLGSFYLRIWDSKYGVDTEHLSICF